MRRLLVVAALVVLTAPGEAPAKIQGALRICGASDCLILDRHTGHEVWEVVADLTGGSTTGPARPGPYYELAILPLDERGRPQANFPMGRFYYAPRAERLRTSALVDVDDGIWRTLAAPPASVAAAVRRVRPFPAPSLVRVEVDGRAAADAHSYLRLFRIAAGSKPIADPAGPYPLPGGEIAQLSRYWERVGRHWLPVVLWTRRPSPWGDESTSVWVGKRQPLVRRDREIVRVPRELAARIRAGRSLRS